MSDITWHPIEELPDRYAYNLMVLAPELVDLDCNEAGAGMAYWQDGALEPFDDHGACGEPGKDYGSFMACKWSMTNDEWYEVPCNPTHYAVIGPPFPVDTAGIPQGSGTEVVDDERLREAMRPGHRREPYDGS